MVFAARGDELLEDRFGYLDRRYKKTLSFPTAFCENLSYEFVLLVFVDADDFVTALRLEVE